MSSGFNSVAVEKKKLHVVSLSGGKDSTAMLLMMLERKMPVDMILFCDTGMEFPAMYEHLDKLEKYIGREITRIRSEKSFLYYLLEHQPKWKNEERERKGACGYSWPGPRMRWCTSHMKTLVIDKYLSNLAKEYEIIHYVGIAADEKERVKNLCYPLVEWGVTEKEALQYCLDKGFDFGGLYELFDRVSCWCCPLQGLAELRNLRKFFPDLWKLLMEWDARTWRQFRKDYSVEELEKRFAFEEECLKNGHPIKGKAFFHAMRQRIGRKCEIEHEETEKI